MASFVLEVHRTSAGQNQAWEEVMLNVTVESIGELAVVECEGRIVQREAAVKLRKAVTSQTDARIVVLELSEVHAIEGGGLGTLVFLRRWALEHNILLAIQSFQVRTRRAEACQRSRSSTSPRWTK
jgi:anti-anti-sigma regulatory factor